MNKCLLICLVLFCTHNLHSQELQFFNCYPLYGGVDAGYCFGIGKSSSRNNGANGTGRSFNAKTQSGWTINAQLGYQLNCWSSIDIQYVFLNNNYKWQTLFPGNFHENLSADLHSHLALINYRLYLGHLFHFACFDPYITGGVGVAFNRFFDIKERQAVESPVLPNVVFGIIDSRTHSNFCAQVGAGIRRCFCQSWIVNLKFNAYYLGTFSSGDSRKGVAPFPLGTVLIQPYKFKHNWIGAVTLGLGYSF